MSDNSLSPIEQKTVTFYDDELTAVTVEENGRRVVYVPLRPFCDYLGVDWSGQRQRIGRDPVLADVVKNMSVGVTPPDIDPSSKRPRTSDMLCLPLDYLNGWLFSIQTSRVKEEVRENLIRYQRECYRVLADAFLSPAPTTPSSTLMQVREMGLAIARMAEEQMEFDRRLMTVEGNQADTQTAVTNLTERIERLETGSPETAVTEAQASQLSQAVKAVAIAQGKVSGRNEFGAVYGEMYRKFGITSYKMLPASRFAECMRWLTDWHEELGGSVPF